MTTPPPPCRYAELAARVALISTGTPVPVPPLACEITATHRVKVEVQSPGIATWTVAEVCVMCAHMARDLPGFVGNPWPIAPGPILPSSSLPPALERALRGDHGVGIQRPT